MNDVTGETFGSSMKRILFVTDSYGEISSANAICTKILANEFLKRGMEVHMLCMQEGKVSEYLDDGVIIHTIHPDIVVRLANYSKRSNSSFMRRVFRLLSIIINRIEAVTFLPVFPLRAPLYVRKYTRTVKRINNMYSFDVMIASYRPFESVYALYKLKKQYKFKACMYTLDTLSDFEGDDRNTKVMIRKGYEWEKKLYAVFDLILNPKCHEDNYNQSMYDEFREKLVTTDFPHIYERNQMEMNIGSRDTARIQMIYAGALRGTIVPKMLDCMSNLLDSGKAYLEVYGYNTIDSLQGYQNNTAMNNIIIKGNLSHERMMQVERMADILISIGNAGTIKKFVPSKIFEYMSTGRKILHFCESKEDSCIEYYKRYPNACVIDVNDDIQSNKNKIETFVFKEAKQIDHDELRVIFPMNTPEYTARVILEKLGM